MTNEYPLYPNITVKLTGVDGNAYNILGIVYKALCKKGVPEKQTSLFMIQATAGDYDNLLQTVMKWVTVE